MTINNIDNEDVNNFSVRTGIAGLNRTLTVYNSNAAANPASAATIISSVNGAAVGNPTYKSVITGVQTWTWGADNAHGDNFVIAGSPTLGTTDVMRITPTGFINLPLQQMFCVYLSFITAGVTGAGFKFQIPFDQPIVNQSGSYDFVGGNFVAQQPGNYFFIMSASIVPPGGATITAIHAGFTNSGSGFTFDNFSGRAASADPWMIQSSAMYPLAIGDTVSPYIYAVGDAGNDVPVEGGPVDIHTYFMGWLVG